MDSHQISDPEEGGRNAGLEGGCKGMREEGMNVGKTEAKEG